ncbi:hypothetical protein [Thermococcus peptonophilus]|uniref:hypothetical protein n=1 Tax=Thermococcus peptonophilus TaxID=53952 RepID=UPI000AF95F92
MNVGGGPADVGGIVNAVGSTFSMLGGLFWGGSSATGSTGERYSSSLGSWGGLR